MKNPFGEAIAGFEADRSLASAASVREIFTGPDDESPTEEDPVIIPEDQADLDSLFGDLDGSLQDELLTV